MQVAFRCENKFIIWNYKNNTEKEYPVGQAVSCTVSSTDLEFSYMFCIGHATGENDLPRHVGDWKERTIGTADIIFRYE